MDKKTFRTKLGANFQKQGDFVHIDNDGLARDFNTPIEYTIMTVDEANELFNDISESNGFPRLQTATGYMPLQNNVYDYLKEAYADEYETQLDKIDGGFAYGSTYALEAVLNDLDNKVRKDSKKLVPESASYNELRFVEATDEIADKIDDFAKARVIYTSSWSIRRKVTEETLLRQQDQLKDLGLDLKDLIHNEIKNSNNENQNKYVAEHTFDLESVLDGLEMDTGLSR